MSTRKYADRAFFTVNGFEALHVVSGELDIDDGVEPKDTMTRNYRSAGYVQRNRRITMSLEMAIDADQAQIDLSLADPTADIQVVWECGGERFVSTGVRQTRQNQRGSVGDAGKTLSLVALDVVNENGVSVNTGISLG